MMVSRFRFDEARFGAGRGGGNAMRATLPNRDTIGHLNYELGKTLLRN
jgi:hypothetical protein